MAIEPIKQPRECPCILGRPHRLQSSEKLVYHFVVGFEEFAIEIAQSLQWIAVEIRHETYCLR